MRSHFCKIISRGEKFRVPVHAFNHRHGLLDWFIHLAVTHLRYHSSTHTLVDYESDLRVWHQACVLGADGGYQRPRAAGAASKPVGSRVEPAAQELSNAAI